MKYVLNKGRYALAFEIVKDNRRVKIEFDKKRIFMDTGNIATTGITPVEDEDYEKLCEFKRFKQLFETGEFELTDVTKIETAETKVKELEEANRKLEEELKKARDNTPAKTKKQLEDKDKEIRNLKEQLEALSKGDKAPVAESEAPVAESEDKDVTEGF